MDPVNVLLGLLSFIPYHLALAFIGATVKFKSTIIPGLIFSYLVVFSRVIYNVPQIIHTVIIMLVCAILLHMFHKIDFLLSIIGSILSYITIILGSLLIVCPLLILMGLQVPKETTGLTWILLNLSELFIPSVVLIVLKVEKITPIKYIIKI
jgi:hypothetical protein